MSLIKEIASSEAIQWLNTTLKERSKLNDDKPPPKLDGLRAVPDGGAICEVPEIARWYFQWGLEIKQFARHQVPHAEGFKNIEGSMLMRLGWYETYLVLPPQAIGHYMKRAFWTFDICKGGAVVGVTLPRFKHLDDPFTTMPR
jgi:hypothetical protein